MAVNGIMQIGDPELDQAYADMIAQVETTDMIGEEAKKNALKALKAAQQEISNAKERGGAGDFYPDPFIVVCCGKPAAQLTPTDIQQAYSTVFGDEVPAKQFAAQFRNACRIFTGAAQDLTTEDFNNAVYWLGMHKEKIDTGKAQGLTSAKSMSDVTEQSWNFGLFGQMGEITPEAKVVSAVSNIYAAYDDKSVPEYLRSSCKEYFEGCFVDGVMELLAQELAPVLKARPDSQQFAEQVRYAFSLFMGMEPREKPKGADDIQRFIKQLPKEAEKEANSGREEVNRLRKTSKFLLETREAFVAQELIGQCDQAKYANVMAGKAASASIDVDVDEIITVFGTIYAGKIWDRDYLIDNHLFDYNIRGEESEIIGVEKFLSEAGVKGVKGEFVPVDTSKITGSPEGERYRYYGNEEGKSEGLG